MLFSMKQMHKQNSKVDNLHFASMRSEEFAPKCGLACSPGHGVPLHTGALPTSGEPSPVLFQGAPSLGCSIHMCFSVLLVCFVFPLVVQDGWVAGIGYFPPPCKSGSGYLVSHEGRPHSGEQMLWCISQ